MVRIKGIAALLASMATAACVPMEQASLTYTSKTTAGVGVTAGSQDSPGLDVTIGFKEINIALVPVAVAKYCYKAEGALCQNDIYNMKMIKGGKEDKVGSSAIQTIIKQSQDEIDDLSRKQTDIAREIGTIVAKMASQSEARSASKELKEKYSDQSDDPTFIKSRDELKAKEAQIDNAFDLSAAQQRLAHLEIDQKGVLAEISSKQKSVEALKARVGGEKNGVRKDAYSVYGKFSGNGSGGRDGGGLTIGKVFATGIAAQNLTEFSATTDCLSKIQVLAEMLPEKTDSEKTAKSNFLAKGIETCRPIG